MSLLSPCLLLVINFSCGCCAGLSRPFLWQNFFVRLLFLRCVCQGVSAKGVVNSALTKKYYSSLPELIFDFITFALVMVLKYILPFFFNIPLGMSHIKVAISFV